MYQVSYIDILDDVGVFLCHVRRCVVVASTLSQKSFDVLALTASMFQKIIRIGNFFKCYLNT